MNQAEVTRECEKAYNAGFVNGVRRAENLMSEILLRGGPVAMDALEGSGIRAFDLRVWVRFADWVREHSPLAKG